MDYKLLFQILAVLLILPVFINVVFKAVSRHHRPKSRMHPLVVATAFASCFIQAGLLIYAIT